MANVTAKTSHTVQMKDGTTRAVNRGDSFDVDDTSEAYQESLETDYGKDLVSTGGDGEDATPAPTSVPPRMDPGRTLPESGVDLEADEKFAEGDANTGDDVQDMGVQREAAAEAAAAAAAPQEAEGLPKRPATSKAAAKDKEAEAK